MRRDIGIAGLYQRTRRLRFFLGMNKTTGYLERFRAVAESCIRFLALTATPTSGIYSRSSFR